MRGAYYVVTALLVAASSQLTAKSNQTKPLLFPDHDFVEPSGTLDDTLSLQKSRDPQDDSALNEERTPSVPSSFLEDLKQTFTNAYSVTRMNEEDVIAKAANAIENHEKWMPMLEAKSSKRQRIDPTPNNVDEPLHAVPNSGNPLVSVANNMPFVLANELDRGEPTVIIKNAVRSIMQHNHRSAPSTTYVATSSGQHSNQLNSQKALLLDLNKSPDEMEIENSQRQRIDPTPNNVDGLALHALPNPEKSPVLVSNIVPYVLAIRGKGERSTVIIDNAANIIKTHNFQHALPIPSTSSATAPGVRLDDQLISQKALKVAVKKHPDVVESHSVAHLSHLREGNDEVAQPATVHGESVLTDWRAEIANGPRLYKTYSVNDKVIEVHEAFLKAFRLPFHQYPQETAKMMKIVRYIYDSSPTSNNCILALTTMAGKQTFSDLKRLLGPDLKKFLSNEELVLEHNEKNMRDAYFVKLTIMYELFYEFCHSRKDLFKNLPQKSDRNYWIFELASTKSGSYEDQISQPHS